MIPVDASGPTTSSIVSITAGVNSLSMAKCSIAMPGSVGSEWMDAICA